MTMCCTSVGMMPMGIAQMMGPCMMAKMTGTGMTCRMTCIARSMQATFMACCEQMMAMMNAGMPMMCCCLTGQ